jgi:hypothetical protein
LLPTSDHFRIRARVFCSRAFIPSSFIAVAPGRSAKPSSRFAVQACKDADAPCIPDDLGDAGEYKDDLDAMITVRVSGEDVPHAAVPPRPS